MTRQAISTTSAPARHRAVQPGDRQPATSCSAPASSALDPATGELVEGGVEAQTERALRNLERRARRGRRGFADVVKTTVFLADIGDFAAMNAVYARFLPDPPPARSTFAVGALPKGGRVEIEAIARTVAPSRA